MGTRNGDKGVPVWGQESPQFGHKGPWVGDKRWGRRGPRFGDKRRVPSLGTKVLGLGTKDEDKGISFWGQEGMGTRESLGWGQEMGTKGVPVWGQEESPQFGDKGPWVGDEMGTKGSQFGDKKGWVQEVEIRESQFGDKRWGPRGPSLGTRGEPPVWGQRPSGWGRVPRLGSRVLFWGQMPPGWGQEPWFGAKGPQVKDTGPGLRTRGGDKGHWVGKCPQIGVKG